MLSRGLGRSYGDSSLPASPADKVVATRLANRILGFDEASGVLRAEAGFSLHELNRLFIPRGYFSPVTPGTKFVTVGGCIANDIHGKAHHCQGSFSNCVEQMTILLANGETVTASRTENAELFWATFGGMDVLGAKMPETLRLSLAWPAVASAGLTTLLTMLAGGLLPAVRASRLKPVEATRYI